MNNLDDFSFGEIHRVLKEADFIRVKSKGRRRSSKNFILLQLANDISEKRVGIIVTRKVGRAWLRNKWKRYVKEFFRCNKKIFPASTDSVFIIKRGAEVPKNFHLISDELRKLVAGRG